MGIDLVNSLSYVLVIFITLLLYYIIPKHNDLNEHLVYFLSLSVAQELGSNLGGSDGENYKMVF